MVMTDLVRMSGMAGMSVLVCWCVVFPYSVLLSGYMIIANRVECLR